VPDQHVWSRLAELGKCAAQVEIELVEGLRLGPGVAPRISGPIIGADARETGDSGLHKDPVEGEVAKPVFDDDGGASMASAVDVKAVCAQIHKLSGWLARGCSFRTDLTRAESEDKSPDQRKPDKLHNTSGDRSVYGECCLFVPKGRKVTACFWHPRRSFCVKSDEWTGSDDERQARVTPFFGNSESSKS
jgi:hypothetical protein